LSASPTTCKNLGKIKSQAKAGSVRKTQILNFIGFLILPLVQYFQTVLCFAQNVFET
jgi:hypothetical protein